MEIIIWRLKQHLPRKDNIAYQQEYKRKNKNKIWPHLRAERIALYDCETWVMTVQDKNGDSNLKKEITHLLIEEKEQFGPSNRDDE